MVDRPQVVIVGAGPAGLALAMELGSRGVGVLIVERNDRVGIAPRAKTTNVRTRTHLRRWGLASKLAAASPFGVDFPNDVLFVTRLAGHRLAHIKNAFNAHPARNELYPEHAQWVPQYRLEEVLREGVATLPTVEVRFGVSFVSAEQDEAHCHVRLRGADGEETVVDCDYLVGADGARSRVREAIGATMVGVQVLGHHHNVIFRAPHMACANPQPPAVMIWQINDDGLSVIGPMDQPDKWFFTPVGLKPGERLTDAEAIGAITRTTGIEGAYEILSADDWTASGLLADRYAKGRIFLAGDACHLHSPFGGYGMNMGVGDAVDLGWKIAATLQGWGGPGLLASYEAERRPVHEVVLEEAAANHATLTGPLYQPGIEADGAEGDAVRALVGERIMAAKPREFHTLGTVLGLTYEGSPLITAEPGDPNPCRGAHYIPSARPGRLAPHAWLDDGRSLYDLFGQGFTLIAFPGASADDIAAAKSDAATGDIPLEIVSLDRPDLTELYEAPLALIRPDQHVVWRGSHWSGSALQRAAGNCRRDYPTRI
jgi:2-polyprenyl-6-methoxyphenol hydroxylase-like FAD-dependent oxidoreductase